MGVVIYSEVIIRKMKHLHLLGLALLFSGCQPKVISEEEYFKNEKYIWNTYVPKSGQANSIQGEMLRACEKLANEAQRNGNGNFNDDCHKILLDFLRIQLNDPKVFGAQTIKQINNDLDLLSNPDEPYTREDVYERIRKRIVDWYLKNPKPILHLINPKLNC